MKTFIASLLFFPLLGIRVPASFAQSDQSYQKLAQEMKVLKTQFSAVQSQLQTVENTDKMKLLTELDDAKAKLADAKAKLINAEFGNFERKLRDSNDDWLKKWIIIFLAFISAVGIAILTVIWNHFKSTIDSLIASEVGKRVNRFEKSVNEVDILKNYIKEAIGQVSILESKVRVLNKEHAVEVVERFMNYPLSDEDSFPEQMKELSEEVLLDVLGDGTRNLYIRIRVLEILTRKESDQLVSPTFKLLNSTLDSHQDQELSLSIASDLRNIVDLLGWTPTQDTYEGLTKFLNRLLVRKNTEFKALLLAATASSFARVSRELNKENWVSQLKTSFSRLDNEPETIKNILHFLDKTADVDDFEDYLLELLEKHDPENDQSERKANANTETKESS